jgi:hypothetical protein
MRMIGQRTPSLTILACAPSNSDTWPEDFNLSHDEMRGKQVKSCST